MKSIIYLFLFLCGTVNYAQQLHKVYDRGNTVFFSANSFLDQEKVSEYSNSYVDQNFVRRLSEDKREFFTLPLETSKRLLVDVHFSKTDSVYYYNYYHNVSYSFPVSDLMVKGHWIGLDLTMDDKPYYDVEVGFALDKAKLKGIDSQYFRAFISVGRVNPFLKRGNVHVAKWEELKNPKPLISLKRMSEECNRACDSFQQWRINQTFKSQHGEMDFYVYQIVGATKCSAYYLVIYKRSSNLIVSTSLYFDNEIKSYNHIMVGQRKEDLRDDEIEDSMWVGDFLKGKQNTYWGLESYQYVCPKVYFIYKDELQVECIIYTG